MWNPKVIDTDKSLYIAIADALERDVRNGTLKPGDRMPTHRELAEIIGVNVTTVTRAYRDAEKRGLVSGTVGRGTYVAADSGTDSSMAKPGERVERMIEMGLVLPLYKKEPDVSAVMTKVMKDRNLNRYMSYTDPLGLPEHRETGSYWVKRYGIGVPKENVLVCSGAQHALTCSLAALFKAGDRIAADYLVYPGMKAIAKTLGLKLEPVMMDEEGMNPESLKRVCQRNPVKGVYLMPGLQNPTTSAMSMQRKRELAEIILRYGLLLIEDEVYSFSRPENGQAVTSLIPDNSVYIAGISKAFYAGLRVAFAAAPKQLLHKIGQAVVNTMWMTPALNAAIACECIRDGTADRIIRDKLEETTLRLNIAREVLDGKPGSSDTKKGASLVGASASTGGTSNYGVKGIPGGFFVWYRLPGDWSGKEFEYAARERGVNLFCADKFVVGGEKAPRAVRISLTGAETMEEFGRGLTILKELLSGGVQEYREQVGFEPIL